MPLRLFFGLWHCIQGHLWSPSWWPFQPCVLSLLPHKPHCFMSRSSCCLPRRPCFMMLSMRILSHPPWCCYAPLKPFVTPPNHILASHDSRHKAPLVLISLVARNNLHFALSVRFELLEIHTSILFYFLPHLVEGACFPVFVDARSCSISQTSWTFIASQSFLSWFSWRFHSALLYNVKQALCWVLWGALF